MLQTFKIMTEYGVQFVMKDGSIMSHADTSKWDKLPRYKKIWGNIFKRYKRKFITPRPFRCELK